MIFKDKKLKPYNTFGIDITAKNYAVIHSEKDLIDLSETNEWSNNDIFILGGGSNILFVDSPTGLTIHMQNDGIEIINEDKHHVYVQAGAGVVWNDLVEYALKFNLGGIENLILIPGKCGAAPMQNIGAYGVELEAVFDSLHCFIIKDKSFKKFNKVQCQFGYRDSIFKNELKGKAIITSITLKLNKVHTLQTSYGAIQLKLDESSISKPTIHDVAKAVREIRMSKLPDPTISPNAGSFFKNPIISKSEAEKIRYNHPFMPWYPAGTDQIKVPAGWLIEQCGWKGKIKNGVGTWKHQALVLINEGNASGQQVLEIARNIQEDVVNKFGITLEPEVNIIG